MIQKTLVAIFTTKDRWEYRTAIEDTWMNSLDKNKFDVKFVYSNGDDRGTSETDSEIRFSNVEESYENLPLKTYSLFSYFNKWMLDRYHSIFKCNDDIFIDGNLLNQLDFSNYDYVGKFNYPISSYLEFSKIKKSKKIHWHKCRPEWHLDKKVYPGLKYAEGSGYYVSRESISNMLKTDPNFWVNTPETYKGEDVAVGLCLNHVDLRLRMLDTKNQTRHINCPLDIWENGILIHPVHHSLIRGMYALKNVDERLQLLYDNKHLNDYVIRDSA